MAILVSFGIAFPRASLQQQEPKLLVCTGQVSEVKLGSSPADELVFLLAPINVGPACGAGPLSLWLFQYGWWLDIVLPLIVQR